MHNSCFVEGCTSEGLQFRLTQGELLSSLSALYILKIDALLFPTDLFFKVLFIFFRQVAEKYWSYSTVSLHGVTRGHDLWQICSLGRFPLPGQWNSAWGPGGLQPRPMDTAAAPPFAGSTSSRTECVSHTHKHRGHTEDAGTDGDTGCHAEGTALSCTFMQHYRDVQEVWAQPAKHLSSFSAGQDWSPLVKAHTPRCRFTSTHTLQTPKYWHSQSVWQIPLHLSWTLLPATLGGSLLTCWSSLGLAGKQVLTFFSSTLSYQLQRLDDPTQSCAWSFLMAHQLLTGDSGLRHQKSPKIIFKYFSI